MRLKNSARGVQKVGRVYLPAVEAIDATTDFGAVPLQPLQAAPRYHTQEGLAPVGSWPFLCVAAGAGLPPLCFFGPTADAVGARGGKTCWGGGVFRGWRRERGYNHRVSRELDTTRKVICEKHSPDPLRREPCPTPSCTRGDLKHAPVFLSYPTNPRRAAMDCAQRGK